MEFASEKIGEVTDQFRAVGTELITDKRKFAYLLLAPPLLMMTFVHFLPVLWGIIISFMDVNSGNLSTWTQAPIVGLDNYIAVYDPSSQIGQEYYSALRQTIIFSLGTIFGSYILGIAAAILLNQDFRGKLLARIVILLPWITPLVVTFYSWRLMFVSEGGLINSMLSSVGIIDQNILWLVGDNSMWALITVMVWRNFPLVAMLVYASLQSIPQDLYEAAEIDGAGKYGKFRYITLPHIYSVSSIVVLLLTLWSLINFSAPYILFGQAPPEPVRVLMLYIYQYSFNSFEFGLGSAMSVGLFALAMAFTVVYFKKTLGEQI